MDPQRYRFEYEMTYPANDPIMRKVMDVMASQCSATMRLFQDARVTRPTIRLLRETGEGTWSDISDG